MLLHNYPQYRGAFQRAARNGLENDRKFNQGIRQDLAQDWPVVSARWRLMCHDLDYGFDWSREQVELSMEDATWDGSPLKIEIAADQGWQSIGVRLEAGMKLKVLPQGRCQLAAQPKPWMSEPPGITFRYHRSRPLGQLLACIVPNAPDNAKTLHRSRSPRSLKVRRSPSKKIAGSYSESTTPRESLPIIRTATQLPSSKACGSNVT